MEEQKINILNEKFKKYLNKTNRESLREELKAADEEAFVYLANMPLKRTLATTLLSIIFGGWSAGRLYLGNYKFAAFVIALTLILFFSIYQIEISALPLIPKLILLWILAIADFIWTIFQVFRTRVVCHRQNYAAVSGYLKKTRKN